jgi:arabinan endo-1,5-alpha-L-arabinosidase
MLKQILILFILSILLQLSGFSQNAVATGSSVYSVEVSYDTSLYYKNPVFEPDLADPTIIKSPENWFYAYGTENYWDETLHRLVPVIRSRDLVNWEYIRDAFDIKPDWKRGGIWAPEITYLQGKYYMYYAFSTWGDKNAAIGLAISENPEGPFTDQGMLFNSEEIGVFNSIDPSCFRYNGKNYLIWGSLGGGIYGIELSDDGKKIAGQKFQIAGNSFEAAYIYQKDEDFYLFVSTSTCCEGAQSKYRVVVGRSKDFKGPYTTITGQELMKQNNNWQDPLVDQITGVILSGNETVAGPGHNAQIVTDDRGVDWFIYHGILRSDPLLPKGATRRSLFIDPIDWSSGWPVINQGKCPGTEPIEKPFFKTKYSVCLTKTSKL